MQFTLTIPDSFPPLTVKALLEQHYFIPRKVRHILRTKKHLLINGRSVHWQTIVYPSDRVQFLFDKEDYPSQPLSFGQKEQVKELFQDEHLIVVNKPSGMKTHANSPSEMALLNHVSAYVGQPCFVVHRLDKATSGAVLFAKNPFVLPVLNHLLEERNIRRHYLAIVQGQPLQNNWVITDPIGRHRHDRRKRIVDKHHGKSAETHVQLISSFGQHALVSCQLKTGRTHQIRVHLSHHGHPIIGDPLYGSAPGPRLMLHANQLEMIHPFTLETITVTAPCPSFDAYLQQIKKDDFV